MTGGLFFLNFPVMQQGLHVQETEQYKGSNAKYVIAYFHAS